MRTINTSITENYQVTGPVQPEHPYKRTYAWMALTVYLHCRWKHIYNIKLNHNKKKSLKLQANHKMFSKFTDLRPGFLMLLSLAYNHSSLLHSPLSALETIIICLFTFVANYLIKICIEYCTFTLEEDLSEVESTVLFLPLSSLSKSLSLPFFLEEKPG